MKPREFVDYIIIKKSRAFDPAYYLLQYADIRQADVDPLWHFVTHGWKEGRNPSPKFDTEYYLRKNPDVKQAGVNPLVHYLRFGRREGRAPHPHQWVSSIREVSFVRPRALQKAIYNVGVKIYWAIPPKHRQSILHWLYAYLGFLFRGMPDYEGWRSSHLLQIDARKHSPLVDLKTVPPAEKIKSSVGIHLHVFYPDLAKELAGYLRNMPVPYSLFVSVCDDDTLKVCQRTFVDLPLCSRVEIRRVPNRGRNIAPMLCTFGKELSQYDYVAHLHTKKSLYNRGATEGWGEYLYRSLLGSQEQIRRIFSLMQGKEPCGIVYAQNYVLLPYWANTWLANREQGRIWGARLGVTKMPRGYFDYPAGSMFWARADALAPLFRAGIALEDFPEESGQTDGTLAHTIERLLALCTLGQGMRYAIIQDTENPSWSPWRFDQYLNRSYQSMVWMFHSPQVRLIAFDVFDTLLCRPLLNPETVKSIVARCVGGEIGSLYRQYRAIAEHQTRQAKGSDVGIDEIYSTLGKLTGLSLSQLTELQQLEVKTEKALIEPRWETLNLLREAVATGKPVILITDTFLSRQSVEEILREHNVIGWDRVFVSSEIGLRKDNGRLYDYVLSQFNIKPAQMLMVGDDERSDTQIPCDMGASFIHLLRPVELARGLPRFADLIATHEQRDDIDAEITLGLVVRKNFSPVHFPNFDPTSLVQVTPYNLGYSLVGPLLVSFANWLVQQARKDGVNRLYFLSREGKLMKEVYDCWTSGMADVPRSEYLVISRRAAGVAAISTFNDILDIARMIYFPNTIEKFLHTRYGLSLEEEQWNEIARTTGWDRAREVSVRDGKIDHLLPLLRALETEIMSRVNRERPALLRYLADKGLTLDDHQAVVDVGYGGSVQKYLNRLLLRKVHGYYMMTDDRASGISETYGVILRGCFCESVTQSPNAPAMYRYSFNVEKLLSSVEPQLEYYEEDATGNLEGRYRDLSPSEISATSAREEIRKGALDYARDASYIRRAVLSDFQPSCWTAHLLMEAFLTQMSPTEDEFLSHIVLDDYYCGRDLV